MASVHARPSFTNEKVARVEAGISRSNRFFPKCKSAARPLRPRTRELAVRKRPRKPRPVSAWNSTISALFRGPALSWVNLKVIPETPLSSFRGARDKPDTQLSRSRPGPEKPRGAERAVLGIPERRPLEGTLELGSEDEFVK